MKSILNRETIKEKKNTKEAEAWRNACLEYYATREKYRVQKAKINNFKKYNRLTENNLKIISQYCENLKTAHRDMLRFKRAMIDAAMRAFNPKPMNLIFKPSATFLLCKEETACLIVSLMNAYNQFPKLGPNAKLILQLDKSRLKVDIKKGDGNVDKN